MQPGQPSRTAIGAARHRAAHQVLDHGAIFDDPLAMAILGENMEAVVSHAQGDPLKRALRLFIAVRSRFAEDALATAVAAGVTQLVILGAGLDTFAFRSPLAKKLRIFEVDHPATQAWKRERLANASIAIPDTLTFAPVDFERDTLASGLARAGFEVQQATFFTWLGVVPYLTEHAVFATLGFIATLPAGSQVVFDYANPPPAERGALREAHDKLSARVASIGERFVSYFATDALHARLRDLGLREIDDLGPARIAARCFPGKGPVPRDAGGHVVRAAK